MVERQGGGGRQSGKRERNTSLTQCVNAARTVQRSFLWANSLSPHPFLLLLRIRCCAGRLQFSILSRVFTKLELADGDYVSAEDVSAQ